jgi:hypothetical protein
MKSAIEQDGKKSWQPVREHDGKAFYGLAVECAMALFRHNCLRAHPAS